MDVTGPRYSTTAAELRPSQSLQEIRNLSSGLSRTQTQTSSSDFQTISPETKSLLATLVDLLTGKFASKFELNYSDSEGNSDNIQKQTQLPSIFEFESGDGDTAIDASAFGPDAEMHIATRGGNDSVTVMANNVRIVTGDGDDTIQADAAYISAAISGAGDDVMYLSGATIGDVMGGEGDDIIDAWANFVGRVNGDEGQDELRVGGRQIGFVDGGAGDDRILVEAETGKNNTGGGVTDVGGGSGNDTISVAGINIGSVHGDEGQDTITVEARETPDGKGGHVGSVDGGEGDDVISIYASQVDSVAGGEGNDTITINAQYGRDGTKPIDIRGGSGDDTVTVNGTANIYFGRGDGQDSITLSGGGNIILSDGLELDPEMQIYRSGSLLQVTFGNGDALVLDIGPEDQMQVSMKDNIIQITPIMTTQADETA
jgi:Ca2+-binding RTX toxin-like protein